MRAFCWGGSCNVVDIVTVFFTWENQCNTNGHEQDGCAYEQTIEFLNCDKLMLAKLGS